MNKNIGTSAGFLALLAMVFHVSSPGSKERSHGAEIAAKATVETPAERKASEAEQAETGNAGLPGPWIATRTFLFSGERPVPGGPNGKALNLFDSGAVSQCAIDESCKAQLRQFFGLNGSHPFEFLLATVSDPLRTRLALGTDDAINGIEEAASENDWEFAGQWLPWPGGLKGAGAAPDQRSLSSADLKIRALQPGILIFRHSSIRARDTRVLCVLLVGETPTGGINGLQFKMARAYMHALSDSQSPVRLLSPTFSGSFYSLAELLEQDKVAFGKGSYLVRSGTATSEGGAKMLMKLADFKGTNEDMSDQRSNFRQLLRELRIPTSRAAYLVEGESAYGNEFAQETTKSREPIRTLRFPREVSHLRNAYREAITQSAGESVPTPDLNFTLKDSGGGEDGVPVFSETQTPLSQNAVMQQIVNEIRRNRIRIVEAGATNVLDLLFVARVLREQCPDTRLVVGFPDLLFVQAQQAEPLSGILALSTYPLFFEREQWMRDRTTGVTFTDMNAQGIYNAAVLLLNPHNPNPPQLANYNWTGQQHPPGWLMLLDHAGFSPVEVFAGGAAGWYDNRGNATTMLRLPWPSRPWMLVSLMCAGLSLSLCVAVFRLMRNPAARLLAAAAPDLASEADAARQFFLFLLLLMLAFAQLVLRLPWAFQPHDVFAPGLQILLVCSILATLTAAAWIARRLFALRKARGVRPSVAVTTVVFLIATGLWIYCTRPGDVRSFFFSFRSVEMQFGSSPMVPILTAVAALMILAFVHLKRFQLISRQRPTLFTSAFDEGLKGALRKSRREMNRILALPCGMNRKELRSRIAVCAAILVVMCIVLQIPVNFSSIDGPVYDLLCISLQISVIVALLLTCWQIRSAWSWFHLFLTSLGTLPISNALVCVTEAGHTGPIWTRRLNLLSLEIPIESAKTLHDMHLLAQRGHFPEGISAEEVEKWYTKYRTSVQELLQSETATRALTRLEITKRFFRLKYEGAMIANRLSKRVLLPYWRNSRLALPGPSCQEKKEEISELTFEALAERFVALHVSGFALYGVRHIQNLLWFVSLGFVLLVFSVNSYHFQSPQQIGRFLIVLFVLMGFVSWRCMAGMERNTILSRIAGTGEGELNKGFYLKLVSYGALPVVGLLATQFPSISKFLFSWVEPAIEALK